SSLAEGTAGTFRVANGASAHRAPARKPQRRTWRQTWRALASSQSQRTLGLPGHAEFIPGALGPRPAICHFRYVSEQTSIFAKVLDGYYRKWLHRFAIFTAIATLFLICSGGMVTSKGAGLAVPDWPTTFGYNMFLFPVSRWVGGIFFEHVHRLVASTVGILTIILTVWLWYGESRRWLRNLGLAALALVILQGVLGGLRVTLLKDEIGVFHACLAQMFFVLLVVISLATPRLWHCISAAD